MTKEGTRLGARYCNICGKPDDQAKRFVTEGTVDLCNNCFGNLAGTLKEAGVTFSGDSLLGGLTAEDVALIDKHRMTNGRGFLKEVLTEVCGSTLAEVLTDLSHSLKVSCEAAYEKELEAVCGEIRKVEELKEAAKGADEKLADLQKERSRLEQRSRQLHAEKTTTHEVSTTL